MLRVAKFGESYQLHLFKYQEMFKQVAQTRFESFANAILLLTGVLMDTSLQTSNEVTP